MAHSVESHLRLDIAQYDELIRRFIPGYDEMLNELTNYLAFYLADRPHPQVLELGTGTGSLAGLVLSRIATATVVAIDTDPAMIAEARERLAAVLPRVTHLLRDFLGRLPGGTDACMASLALHHITELTENEGFTGKSWARSTLAAFLSTRTPCSRRTVCWKNGCEPTGPDIFLLLDFHSPK